MKTFGLALLLLLPGCHRSKPPGTTRIWLGPAQGCLATSGNETIGKLGCWGVNAAGQLGDGTHESRSEVRASSLGDVTDLAFGEHHGCAVLGHRTLSCWGSLAADSAKPVPMAIDARVTGELSVASGAAHACVRGTKAVQCFGSDSEGQLADGGKLLSGDAPITGLALGTAHTCAAYGTAVRCRGRGTVPNTLSFPSPVTMLVAGAEHTCALLADGTVRCWGRNDEGQLGDGTRNDSLAPVAVQSLANVASITAGARHTCARSKAKMVACWGDNRHHQLADGTTVSNAHPAQIQMLMGVEEIAAGGDSVCARSDDTYVRCWGANDRGQLGDGSTVEHDVPMAVRLR